METWRELSYDEVVMGFVASCIEDAANRIGCHYLDMFNRMERVGLIDKYIYRCYDALHTEDRHNLTTNILETLKRWEENADNKQL